MRPGGAASLKAGQLFSLLRQIVTGINVSPSLLETIAVNGKETVLERIKRGLRQYLLG